MSCYKKFFFARQREFPSSSVKPQTFPAFLWCQIHSAVLHDIDVDILGILFLIFLAGIETYIYLHFWDATSKDYKSEFGQQPLWKPASKWSSLKWVNTSWNCFFRYACFNTSAISVCLRPWYKQHIISASSMLSYYAKGCYPHILGWKSPSSSILIKKLFLR